MEIRFGTDGWRGVMARDFTFDNLALVSQATMEYLQQENLAQRGVVIGYDRRFLSRQFAEKVAEVAAGNGVPALLSLDCVPTPAVSWGVRQRGAGAGIMITASHNPPIYNGFKVKEFYGGSARPATTRKLEQMVVQLQRREGDVREIPLEKALELGKVEQVDLSQPYLDQLGRYVNLELIRRANIPVIIDPMYGAGAGYFSRLLPGSAEIHTVENPSFGGMPPEPTAEHLNELAALVKRGYRLGLALDGDADRIGAIDEQGEYFSSHYIFTVLLRHLYERKGARGGVVKTVSTTRMVDLLAARYGLPLYETPIGFKHICEVMLEHDILMGGEESGGLGVTGHIPERDGILMGLLLLEAMAMSGKGVAQLLAETMAELGPFHYRRWDLPIDDKRKEELIARLNSEEFTTIAGRGVVSTNRRDGFKFVFADGSWLLIRPSGTEPLLRLYSEASSLAHVETLLAAGRSMAGV
ncbi:MAG TPA: phosphoglucomutase/phosphomannomutase family protein [Geobacterales bacterium]|nr:phosphoglucomutase/phosphomannomutase family protein [Geobacterales bacterium]